MIMAKCSSICGGTLPPLSFNVCKSTPRPGGISHFLFKTCDVCIPENAFNVGTDDIDDTVWRPLFEQCKFRLSPAVVGSKGAHSFTNLRTSSCRTERPVGGTQTVEFNDYSNADNLTDYDFWIQIQEYVDSYTVGWFTCDGLFYGFFDFSIELSEIVEDSKEGVKYREGVITIPEYKLLKPVRAEGLLDLANEYINYDCVSSDYVYDGEYVPEDSDFYGCVDIPPPPPSLPCTLSCIETLYEPYVVKMNDDADPTNIIRFYYHNSNTDDCRNPWANNQITITYGPDTVEGGGGEYVTNFTGDLDSLAQTIPGFQAPYQFTRLYEEVEFLTDGVKYVNVEVVWDPASVSSPNNTCTTLSQTYTFDTNSIDNADELCPGPLFAECTNTDFINGFNITPQTATTVQMAPDAALLFDLNTGGGPDGCFGLDSNGIGQDAIYYQISSDADPLYVSPTYLLLSGGGPSTPANIPTFPAGNITTLGIVYTTGPLRNVDYIDSPNSDSVMHICEPGVGTPIIEITFDIGTL